ncbi:MFS transporter, MHS family, proline/betaine transporter [Paucidesulfovibrio gracilis DSM 16080]|uniref:MFS transporter, MHS family, proline/betaine transporter n=1 Tax=Paucidesulfovibrio gracilis DSM 16080 TaxID=1121449 RepID=A0A1T4W4E9_9BACT|nr:MFS transporter [Paucidesulfovibrio gracilis]SKA71591.1 MFS transporter, MHS family, proline/betaine transporter [Paucidesulfovibrio gracilis DSM 16080]
MFHHLRKEQRLTTLVAGTMGNIMEWYDFALYGFMASILSQQFFPSEDKTASLMATYGVFAAGFIMRPLGSALFGWLGDTIGRSKVMLISVVLMTFPTVLLGLLPTYHSIGIWAPIFLVVIRLLQGLSVGGEFSSSVTYLVETSPENQRGLSGSFANVGSLGGMLLGSGMAALTSLVFTSEQLNSWAWRLPFFVAGLLGIGAIVLRQGLPNSKQFTKHAKGRDKDSPLREVLTVNRKQMIQGVLFASAYGAVFYLGLVYIPTWLKEYGQVPLAQAQDWNTAATALTLAALPVAAWVSDKFFRRTHLLVLAFGGIFVLAWPLHSWMLGGTGTSVTISQLVFGLLLAVPCGVAPALFVELFPAGDRLSGYSIAFNLGMGVVGGSTPMLATWLVQITGLETAPGLLMIGWSVVGAGVLFWMRDGSREPLPA